ncbi:sporulation membrane protein YtaF [Paenibacillus humicola]|uniref:sporulation membrane protein YtaF n=1 Tax=Paenibacillus humicola TaxID=3110540 RepID=UPI00237ACE15|nr:sporulation membrane protein YtaF [Paenibacillus humicola]
MLAHAASLLLLAFAVSLDGFGVGVTYGLRRIRIPVLSVIIIACCTGFVVWISMQIGTVLSGYMSPRVAKWIGAVILMGIGCGAIVQWWRRRSDRGEEDKETATADPMTVAAADRQSTAAKTLVVLEWKRLGLVIQILRKPQIADVDKSGIISASEAVLLGFALSIDSFGAGLGAAMLGFSPLLTAVVISTVSALFLLAGLRVGFRFAALEIMKALSVLPGILLIVMGMMRLL